MIDVQFVYPDRVSPPRKNVRRPYFGVPIGGEIVTRDGDAYAIAETRVEFDARGNAVRCVVTAAAR